ncbi:hypothetical protein ACQCT5_04550 [Sutcliffiella halmapala]
MMRQITQYIKLYLIANFFEKIWDVLVEYYKVTYFVLGLILILPPVIRWLFN